MLTRKSEKEGGQDQQGESFARGVVEDEADGTNGKGQRKEGAN